MDNWIEESKDKIKGPYVSLHWYEPMGQIPDFTEEKEVTFDTLEELGEFLKQNAGLGQKVGYGGMG